MNGRNIASLVRKAPVSLLLENLVSQLNELLGSPLQPTSPVTVMADEDEMANTLGCPTLQAAGRNLNKHLI
jgi:hypothetical protein